MTPRARWFAARTPWTAPSTRRERPGSRRAASAGRIAVRGHITRASADRLPRGLPGSAATPDRDRVAAVAVAGLSKRFPGHQALDDVTFTVDAPSLCVLLGANGAGKTTLLRVAAGLLRADRGTVAVAGVPVDPDEPASRRMVGYLPESVPLYGEMRVRAFLSFAARARGIARARVGERVDAAIDQTGLAAVAGRRISALSRGYRQRVGLAQAIVHEPPVLLLDEPTSALDPEQMHDARRLLRELAADRAVIVSTHLLAEAARIADHVVVLHEGRLAAAGSPGTLGHPRRDVRAVVRAPIDDLLAEAATRERSWQVTEGPDGTHRVAVDGGDPEDVARSIIGRGWGLLQLWPPGESLEEAYLRIIGEARSPGG